ncbi:MAG TPA: flagellar filament capping protein FliD [Steroidobacteraceae bacterium]|nr:flagellar filament capping protein FliD [Steroidobacteraceae bacterium]
MSSPISSVQGLASGIQWQQMIDQIMQLEQSRTLDPITAQQTSDQAKLGAWQSYNDVVTTLRDAASKLSDASAFTTFQANAANSPTSGRTLLSATASAGAIPGNYQVEVDDIARAEKLGGAPVADPTVALNLSGNVFVGGRTLTVTANDSLNSIRDKINALNSGTSPSHVSASILTVATGINRLVLTSDTTGSAGIELVENGGSNVLSSLGLASNTLVANTVGSNARSYGFTTATTPIGQALGQTMPTAGAFQVNGSVVNIDLSQDSLTTIAAKINTAVGSAVATVSSEIVNGATVSRLIVNGTVTADPGTGPADQAISTQNLQQLGFLENDRSASELVTPTDAQLKVDGIPLTRSTNSISDALSGITLNLQAAEVGTAVDVSISRDSTAAVKAIQDFADAYNAVSKYVATNTAQNGPLAFDTAIRSTLTQMKRNLVDGVTGLQNSTYTSLPQVGVALDKNGVLQVDTSALTAALASSPSEVQALFATNGSSTLSTIKYMAGSSQTQPGTYTVNVTQAATTPTATGSAIAGTYGNSAVANTMTVTDSFTGRTSTIALADADTASTIASKLNVVFGTDGLRLSASVANGNQLQIDGLQYGSRSSFTLAFLLNGVNAGSQLGFNTTPYTGVDVAGTINGKTATGSGQVLTAPIDPTNPAQGLSVLYTGTTPPETSNVSYVLGLGGAMFAAADSLVQSGNGTIQTQENNIQSHIDSLTQRAADVQERLDQQRAALTKQFTDMETALSKLQAQASALTNQLNALQQQSN